MNSRLKVLWKWYPENSLVHFYSERPNSSRLNTLTQCLFFERKKDDIPFHHIQVGQIFKDDDPETVLADAIDGNLQRSYPMEDVYKVRFN